MISKYVSLGLAGMVFVAFSWIHGYYTGKEHMRNEFAAKELIVVEKRSEIINNRPDDRDTINRLLKGKF